jgi:hypothetical protein
MLLKHAHEEMCLYVFSLQEREAAHNISEIFMFIKYQTITYVIKLIGLKICFNCVYLLKQETK